MNRKGFTLIELIAVIALLAMVLILATFSLSSYLMRGREKSFDIIVNSFEDGVLEAYTSCVANPTGSNFCTNHDIPTYGQSDTIRLSEIVNEGFIEKIKNPWNTSEKCDVDNSYVTVTRDDANNISFTYKTCLICGTHRSEGCN